CALDRIQVGQGQFGVDGLDVRDRVHLSGDVDDVAVLEAAHHVADRVDLADVRQELVAQPLPASGAGDQAGDVDELDRGRHHLLRLDDLRQRVQARVRHRHHADVRLDGAEGEVGRGDARPGQRIEEGRLADVRQADDAALDAHQFLPVWRRFMASLKSPSIASGRTSRASSMARRLRVSSSSEGRPSTQGVTRSLWPWWLLPLPRRWRRPWPSSFMVSRSPFWPPWPPSNFSRAVPGGRSSSAWATRDCSGSSFQYRSAAATDLPERFMNVAGLSRRTVRPPTLACAVSPNTLASTLKRTPRASATESMNQDPALCRVLA